MPSKSKAQHNLMAAVANNPAFAKRVGISKSVGEDFLKADKGRKFAEGGDMKAAKMKAIFSGKESPTEERKEKTAAKKAGMTYKAAERKFEGEKYARGGGIEAKGKTKGTIVKMKRGGKCG